MRALIGLLGDRAWRWGLRLALIVSAIMLTACSPSASAIEGRWQLVAFTVSGERDAVVEGGNTQGTPVLEFGNDSQLSGFVGCNWLSSNPDHSYEYSAGSLVLPADIPVDSGECIPDRLMDVEELLLSVIWSSEPIIVTIDESVMEWSTPSISLLEFTLAEGARG